VATGKAESLSLKQSLLETGKVPKVILLPVTDHTRKKNQRCNIQQHLSIHVQYTALNGMMNDIPGLIFFPGNYNT
jgi:hypothetical protein